MSNTNKLVAAALTGLFTASILAAAPALADGNKADAEKAGSSTPAKEKHACKGHNSCKGQGADGKNACKGKGSCATDGSMPAK